MTFDRNTVLIAIASIGFALMYVIAPPVLESNAVYGEWVNYEGLWVFYFLVLPGILGIAVALLLKGPFAARFARLVLTLGLSIVVAFLVPGKAGADWGSFRLTMILLAIAGAIYVVAGAVTALVSSRKHRMRTAGPSS